MSNPQGPGRQGRKDAKGKAPQQAAGAPGRSEHQNAGHNTRSSNEQGHMQQRPAPSHSREETMEDE